MVLSLPRASFVLAVLLFSGLSLHAPFAHRQAQPPGEARTVLAPRTIVLVRHAEKSAGDPKDPELSPEGKERAEALARLLARASVTRLVSSEYRRTRSTLAPLAEQLGLEIDTRPAAALDSLAAELAQSEPGSVTVVAGHSNTIPPLAALLGVELADTTDGPQGPQLGDDEYDRLFVVSLPPEGAPVRPALLELSYGE